MMKKCILVLTSILLSGCVPVYKKIQPTADFTIVDENQHPIKEAEVVLITNSDPFVHEVSRANKMTDELGKAHFDSIREFQVDNFLMMHGVQFYFWGWCVRKDGYETLQPYYTDKEIFPSEKTIVLKKGKSESCINRH